jgi:hypothetical protein
MPIASLFIAGSGLAQNAATLIICRFFVGLFGGTVASVGSGGTVPDMYQPKDRLTRLDLMICMSYEGAGLGMVLGSLAVAYAPGWRWFAWVGEMTAALTFASIAFMRETNHTIIQERLDDQQNGARVLRARLTRLTRLKKLPWLMILQRPMNMLCTHPVVAAVGLYTGVCFGVLYSMLAAQEYIYYVVYGLELQTSGLLWLSWMIGFAVGTLANSLAQWYIIRRIRASKGRITYRPEMMLYPAVAAAPFVPVALFWAAWTARPYVHFMVPTVALGVYAMVGISAIDHSHGADRLPRRCTSSMSRA